jgi:hypothetical protein
MVEPLLEMRACDECAALNPPDIGFCTACGASLQLPPPLPARTGRRKASADAVERSRARHEFGRIKNIVLTVRSVFWAGVVFAAVQVLVFHVIVVHEFRGDDAWIGTLVGVVGWGQLGLMVAGALLAVGLFRMFRAEREKALAAGGLAAMAGMLSAGFFEYNFGDSEFLMLFLVIVTLPFAAARRDHAAARPRA